MTAASHAPAAAVGSMGDPTWRPRWPSVSPVTDQDLGSLGAAAAAPRVLSRSTVLRPHRVAGGGVGSSAGPAVSVADDDTVEAVSLGSRFYGAAGAHRGRVRDVVDVTSSPPLPAAVDDDPLVGGLPAPLPVAARGPASFRPRHARRNTTAAAAAARQVADDEVVARSLQAEMSGTPGPANGGDASWAGGPAAGGGRVHVHSAAASSRRGPPNAATWGSLAYPGQGGAGAAAATAGAPGSLRAGQMRGRRVAVHGRLRASRNVAAMEMAFAAAREEAFAGGYAGGGYGGGGGFGGGGGHGGGGGGGHGVGGGVWPPVVQEGEDEYTALLRLDDGVDNGKRACPPQVLARLPTTTVGQDGERGIGAGGSSSCCICMETIVAGDVVRRLPCCHLYHSTCIDQWLGVKGVCPVDQRAVKDMVGA